jgi:hypothetical protein
MKTYLSEEQAVVVDRFGNELMRGFSGVTTMITFEKRGKKKRNKWCQEKKESGL